MPGWYPWSQIADQVPFRKSERAADADIATKATPKGEVVVANIFYNTANIGSTHTTIETATLKHRKARDKNVIVEYSGYLTYSGAANVTTWQLWIDGIRRAEFDFTFTDAGFFHVAIDTGAPRQRTSRYDLKLAVGPSPDTGYIRFRNFKVYEAETP